MKNYQQLFCCLMVWVFPVFTQDQSSLTWSQQYKTIQKQLAHLIEKRNQQGHNVLVSASKKGHFGFVTDLIEWYQFPVTQEAFIAALQGGKKDVCSYLHAKTVSIAVDKYSYVFRLACKNGFVDTARVLYNDWKDVPSDLKEGFDICENKNFTFRLSLAKRQQETIYFLLHELKIKPQFLSKKQWCSFLPLYIGIEHQFKEHYQKNSKEDKELMQKALVEYCLRARLIQKWIHYWLGRKKQLKPLNNDIIHKILQICGY